MTTPQESAPPVEPTTHFGIRRDLDSESFDWWAGTTISWTPDDGRAVRFKDYHSADAVIRSRRLDGYVATLPASRPSESASPPEPPDRDDKWNRRVEASPPAQEYAPGERLEAGVKFDAVDIWDAYAAGAKECRANSGLVTDTLLQRACDAYVKLVHLQRGKASDAKWTDKDVEAMTAIAVAAVEQHYARRSSSSPSPESHKSPAAMQGEPAP